MQLGRAIRIMREAKGLRLRELAEGTSVSVSLVSLIESGDREPSLGVLRRIAEVLNVPLDALLSIAQPGEGTLSTSDDRSEGLKAALDRLCEAEETLRAQLE